MLKRFSRILCGIVVAAIVTSLIASATQSTKKINVTYRDIKLSTDGTEFTPLDAEGNVVEPFIYEGTTYLPVRAVGEALGRDVSWNNDTSTVIISGKPAKEINLAMQIAIKMNKARFEMQKSGDNVSLICKPDTESPDTSGWCDFSEKVVYEIGGKAEQFKCTLIPPMLYAVGRAKVKLIIRNENDDILHETEYITHDGSAENIEVDITGCEQLSIEFKGATTINKSLIKPSYGKMPEPIKLKLSNPIILTTDY